ncbi:MAG TPA: M48 family metalloprotease [Bryobacteraceae bacterium]|nr:M48 family metalloprotease [Bryobacteraceae bacterium]
MRNIIAALPLLVLLPCVPRGAAQSNGPTTNLASLTVDQIVDRAISQEKNLLAIMRGEHPITETYIQDLGNDADFGVAPKTDHYFLGKLDLSRGVNTDSFTPKPSSRTRAFDVFTHLFSAEYVPRGFAQMLLIDGAGFDRNHYDFDFVKREFLGDVRAYVFDVAPKKSAGPGRFMGRIWVEDRQFNIVRFNGTYAHPRSGQFYMHFDSWRVNCGPDLWVPFESYSEESALPVALGTRKLRFKAVTRVWGLTTDADRKESELTNLVVDLPSVKDSSDQAADNSPVESRRAFEREGEENILDRVEKANLLAPAGEVEKVLDTVVNNLVVTNNLNIEPEVRARVLLTTPLETFTVGHTIVISRGLLDTLPDEASLAAILAHELAHIALGQNIDTKFAFSDRVLFDDDALLKKFRFARSRQEEDAANTKAIELLQNSPYKDKLNQAGLFLKALGAESERLPNLIKPLFGSTMAEGNSVLRLSALMTRAPELQKMRTDQIAALPLGSRTTLDPWSNRLRMLKIRPVPLLSAGEKMPFELTPIVLNLKYESAEEARQAGSESTDSAGGPTRADAR